jgi:hypothetical protein
MPILIKNIEGIIFDNFEGETLLLKNVEGFYGEEDYIKMGSFEAFLQDFRYASSVEDFDSPPTFGLKIDKDFVTLNISY